MQKRRRGQRRFSFGFVVELLLHVMSYLVLIFTAMVLISFKDHFKKRTVLSFIIAALDVDVDLQIIFF
jgi:hypothetical protein